jgi:hypothetical protein
VIKEGDRYKDCSTGITYRIDNIGKDWIELTLLNRIQAAAIHLRLDAVSKQDSFARDNRWTPSKADLQ